jgi:ribosomal protein S18 acetylase RimI-like enzyme
MPASKVESGQSALCLEILDDLPEWFGIPETKVHYAAAAAAMPMFAYYKKDEPAGFVTLKVQTRFAVEIYVLGVKRRFHRQGIGHALVQAVLTFAAEKKLRYITVKTIAPAKTDEYYARTRKFYEAVGFTPIEVFPTLWGEANPCVMMIRPV